MLGMDLASLSIPDLRRILEIARGRGQADLADSIVAELRARAAAPAAGIAEDTAMGVGAPEPGRFSVAGMRDAHGWDDEDPDLGPRRRAPILILGIAAAVLVAGGVGWGLTRSGAPQGATPAPPAAPPAVIAASPTAAQPAAAAVEPPPAETPSRPLDDAAPPPVAEADAKATRAVATGAVVAARPPSPCRTRATPADRLVCGYPSLSHQHDRMLAAYNRALIMSGGDPLALDAGQAKWRAIRDRVSDRRKLADLYQQRIRELDAITAPPAPPPEPELKAKPEQPIF